MHSSNVVESTTYVVSLAGKTRRGTALSILQAIMDESRADSQLRRMSLEDYVSVLIKDAPYFISKDDLKFLSGQKYESEIDKALQFLAAMPSSGVRILSKKA